MLQERMVLHTNRNFALLWHGQVISQLGHQAFLIAAISFALDTTKSPVLVSLVLVFATLPMVLLGAWGGTIADRYNRRTIIVSADVGRAVVVSAVGLTHMGGNSPDAVYVIFAVVALNGAINAVFAPALYAIIPDLVEARDVGSATALHQLAAQFAVLAGQAFGGVAYTTYGARAIFLLNGAAFAYAALTASLLPRQSRPRVSAISQSSLAALREGLTYVRHRRGMSHMLFTFAAVNCAFMPLLVLLPFYVRDTLERGPEWYGYLLSASGSGALLSSAAAAAILGRLKRRGVAVRTCMAGIAISAFVVALNEREWVAMTSFFAVGLLASLINVTIMSSLQASVPAAVRGRVMGLVVALSSASAPVGMTIGGFAGNLWPDNLPFIFGFCALSILLLSLGASMADAFDITLDQRARNKTPTGTNG